MHATKKVGLEVHTGKIKYMILSRYKNGRRYHNLLISVITFKTSGEVQMYGNERNYSR